MPKFTIPFEYTFGGQVEIEAESIDAAIQQLDDDELPSGEYLDGSFGIQKQVLEELNPDVDLSTLSDASNRLLNE